MFPVALAIERRRALLLAIGVAAASILAVTGILYALHRDAVPARPGSSRDPIGWWLATLSFLGALSIGAAGLWQWRSEGRLRVLFLLVAAGLSAGMVAAEAFAIVTYGLGPPRIPRAVMWVGLAVASLSLVATLGEIWRAMLELAPLAGG